MESFAFSRLTARSKALLSENGTSPLARTILRASPLSCQSSSLARSRSSSIGESIAGGAILSSPVSSFSPAAASVGISSRNSPSSSSEDSSTDFFAIFSSMKDWYSSVSSFAPGARIRIRHSEVSAMRRRQLWSGWPETYTPRRSRSLFKSSTGENGGQSFSSRSSPFSSPPPINAKKLPWALASSLAFCWAFLSAYSILLNSLARLGSSVEKAPVRVRFSSTRLLIAFDPDKRRQKSIKPA